MNSGYLTINTDSSSVKFASYGVNDKRLPQTARGMIRSLHTTSQFDVRDKWFDTSEHH
jgi:hypothetical protein